MNVGIVGVVDRYGVWWLGCVMGSGLIFVFFFVYVSVLDDGGVCVECKL